LSSTQIAEISQSTIREQPPQISCLSHHFDVRLLMSVSNGYFLPVNIKMYYQYTMQARCTDKLAQNVESKAFVEASRMHKSWLRLV
jgi:hypothetical protein